MAVASPHEQLAETPDPYGAYPRLSAQQIEALEALGTRRATSRGQVIFRAGDTSYDFVVVLSGMVAIVEHDHGAERLIAAHGAGRFLGELNLLTGETVFVSAVVHEPGEILVVPADRLRELVARDPAWGSHPARVHHPPLDPDRPPHRAQDHRLAPLPRHAATARVRRAQPAAAQLDRSRGLSRRRDAPARARRRAGRDAGGDLVRREGAAQPDERRARRLVGLPVATASETGCDLVIVGMGPAGLAAAVYGASEGLGTIVVDAVAAGGQAATSSRIENYLGFPSGISGAELAERAAIQAVKFGARPQLARRATSLSDRDGHYVLELDDGAEITSQSVVIATGVHYRTLDIPRLEEFEGASVYYAATEIEAQLCRADPVAIVGGGNSAGQAAVFLAATRRRCTCWSAGEISAPTCRATSSIASSGSRTCTSCSTPRSRS